MSIYADPIEDAELLPAGKLPPALLARLLTHLPVDDPRLLLGPTVGEDAAVIEFAHTAEQLLVAKSDPITFATDEIGFYAVNVCANDLAVTGARPLFYLPTVLLPAGAASAATATAIFQQIGLACRALGIVVAGGHSEITPAVNQPIVAGTMLGEAPRAQVVHSGGAQPGDAILLVGGIPVEGVSIIAREKRAELLTLGWQPQELDAAAAYLHTRGISVLEPALAAAQCGLVTAMHDPTEGGLATGLAELASAAGVDMTVDWDAVPISDLAVRLCRVYDLDPLGTIASGALIATCAPPDVAALQAMWTTLGHRAVVIGNATDAGGGLTAVRNGQSCPFPHFGVDEITKVFGA